MMIDTVNTALEHRPEGFDCVRVNIAASVFASIVVDVLMRFETPTKFLVCLPFVCHYRRIRINAFIQYWYQRFHVYSRDGLCLNIPATLCHSEYGSFGLRTASGFMPVSADIGFICLNCTREFLVERLGSDGVSNPMKHEPSGLLSYANILTKLHRGNALLVCCQKIDRHEPLLQGKSGVLEDRSNANCELLPTLGALVEFAVIDAIDFLRVSAVNANRQIAPSRISKIFATRFLVRESLDDIKERIEGFFRGLFHGELRCLCSPVIYKINVGLSSI